MIEDLRNVVDPIPHVLNDRVQLARGEECTGECKNHTEQGSNRELAVVAQKGLRDFGG